MTITSLLEISTAHITAKTNQWLFWTGCPIVIYPKGTYGWVIPIIDYDEELPTDILHILAYGKVKGCHWIMLDCDGDRTNDLPTYDW
ncbi:hypothetical protein HDC33_000399 [Sporosarcina sp. JAI121]|nr:hypothetical protein [Sporosarcina sp. JAI121]